MAMRLDPFHPSSPKTSLIASICRCSSTHEHSARADDRERESASYRAAEDKKKADAQEAFKQKQERERKAMSPDPDSYCIEDSYIVGDYLILKVKYPNCTKCTYEGNKIMVFHGVSEKDALKWVKIDPHFRAPSKSIREAPSPTARFPGSDAGWNDAIGFASWKMNNT